MSCGCNFAEAPGTNRSSEWVQELGTQLAAATRGEYRIVGELGRGGMAAVFLAEDPALDRYVAIKAMAPSRSADDQAARFLQEARTVAGLSHPNIIPVYAVRETDGLHFFVMRFVEGPSLDAVLRANGPLPAPLVRSLLYQVGAALAHAHGRGVIHRDVKPGNVLLDADGQAVIGDFGVARLTESPGLTATGVTVGTPSYMSPEQCVGTPTSAASDQYSLGVVAYELLSGRLPYLADTIVTTLLAHVNDQPTPLLEVCPHCPPDLEAAIMRMMSKSPADRWPTLEQALDAAGARQLPPEDPTREGLIDLARSGSHPLAPRSPRPSTQHRAALPSFGLIAGAQDSHPLMLTVGTNLRTQPIAAVAKQNAAPPQGAHRPGLRRALEEEFRRRCAELASGSPRGDAKTLLEKLNGDLTAVIRQPPVAAREALRVAQNSQSSIAELVPIFERDPGLAQGILRQANSSYYGRGQSTVLSLSQAVQRVGTGGATGVLLASVMEGMLCRPGGAYAAMLGGVWDHMVRTAPLARTLAPGFGVDAESAFATALLHDVGKLAIFDAVARIRADRRREVKLNVGFFHTVLQRLHEPLGGIILLSWDLSEDVAAATASHHRSPVPSSVDRLSEAVFLAERIDLCELKDRPVDLETLWAEAGLTASLEAVVRCLGEARPAQRANA